MIKIVRSRKYEVGLKNLLTKYEDIDSVSLAIRLFSKNPDDTRLRTHPLRRRLKGRFAFNVDDDIRIIFEWLGKHRVRFLAIGKHKDVYPKSRSR